MCMSIVGDEDAVTPTSGNTDKKKAERQGKRIAEFECKMMAMCVVALADKSGCGMCHWQTIG